MAPPKATYYARLPPQPHHDDQNYVVLPLYNPFRTRRSRIISTAGLLLSLTVVYIFWPSHPECKIVRFKLNRINVHTVPHFTIDISMLITVKVRNPAAYSMHYRALDVVVGYRGKRLGHVRSDDGHVKARGTSYVDAELEFVGIGVLSDVVFLLEDLAKGTVLFDTVTEIGGQLGLLFFDFPLKAKLSCEVLVNTVNQTIVRQNCFRE
ncbi:hypothetical protein L6164_004407 [Bauhinia variegata]|uniref:Uncharacterized protein n=1 Tax=Bauhinia variegata TaxID=167791 RepID=A0ACB9Q4A5_BAUVA|nr:hypothetical protein L6164_004407 [Bauhinia variegata]